MSSGDSDSVFQYRQYFDEFCKQATRLFEIKPISQSSQETENEEDFRAEYERPILKALADFEGIPERFYFEELQLAPDCHELLHRLARFGHDYTACFCDSEIDFMWLLFLTGENVLLNRVHLASVLYHDQLLVFVDSKGNIYPGGVYYQNLEGYRGRSVLDGDADILVGIAKKRGYSRFELQRGQPFMVGGNLNRNGKNFAWSWYSQL